MALVGFHYEPTSLDVSKVCFEENRISLIHMKNQGKVSVTESCRCGKSDMMHTNVEYLSCGKVEALGYFQLVDMKYNDRNVVAKRVSKTVLKLYLI